MMNGHDIINLLIPINISVTIYRESKKKRKLNQLYFEKYLFCLSLKPTVVAKLKRNDCRLLHSGISISKIERRRKLFRFNLVTTVVNQIERINNITRSVAHYS